MKLKLVLIMIVFSLFTIADDEKKKEEGSFFNKIKEAAKDAKAKMEGTDEESLKYYKKRYIETYDNYFEDVFDAVKQSIIDRGCQVIQETERTDNETGLLKGVIKSEECIMAMDVQGDDVPDTLAKYSLQVPVIRGGIWENGRFQYKFVIKEKEDGTCDLILKGEVSGAEMNVTNEVHYWESNGFKEFSILEDIKAKLADL